MESFKGFSKTFCFESVSCSGLSIVEVSTHMRFRLALIDLARKQHETRNVAEAYFFYSNTSSFTLFAFVVGLTA